MCDKDNNNPICEFDGGDCCLEETNCEYCHGEGCLCHETEQAYCASKPKNQFLFIFFCFNILELKNRHSMSHVHGPL